MSTALIRSLLVIFAGLLPAFALAQTAPPDSVIRAAVHRWVDKGRSSGVVLGIWENGKARYLYHGLTAPGGAAVNPQTVYEIGSISKTFTALLLAQLAEQGKVQLDDPAEKYLPAGVKMPNFNGDKITLRQLANHTSGLPRLPANLSPKATDNPYADYTAENLHASLNGYALPRRPGEKYEYSNLGAGLLGHLLERVTGKAYAQLVAERITTPLKMTRTGMALNKIAADGNQAWGYADKQPAAYWDFDALAGAGALRSSAEDLLKYAAAQLAAQDKSLGKAMRVTQQAQTATGTANQTIGLGWHQEMVNGAAMLFHGGGTGGFRSFLGLHPATGRAVVVLTNSTTEVDDLGVLALLPVVPPKPFPKEVTVTAEVLKTYVGAYKVQEGVDFTVTLEPDGQLYFRVTGQEKFPLFAESHTRFFLKVVDAQVEFYPENGQNNRLVLFQNGNQVPAKRRP